MAEERVPAPAPLRLVQEFVNTAVRLYGREDLTDPADLADWLAGRGLLSVDAPVDVGSFAGALQLREALRVLFLPRADGSLDLASVQEVNRVAAAALLHPRLGTDGTTSLHPDAPGVTGALGRLCAVVHTAFADGSWRRLKTCQAPDCRWLYYDRSRNLSSTWCEPALCGTRMRMRAYRNRRTAGAD